MLKSPIHKIFFKYAIPSILGLLCISSASIVDGYFIGNYVGSVGLAAINISYPITTILFGLALMFAVGSSVIVGKLIGEGKFDIALDIFTKAVLSVFLLSIVICFILLLGIDELLNLLNVVGELKSETLEYLPILLYFFPFLMIGIVVDYFVRVDENPNLSFFALFVVSVLNIVLDYLFIVKFSWGINGAALATGISYMSLIFLLIPHFFRKKSSLSFVKPKGSWISVYNASKNGISEFANESSAGITVLIFNYIMLKHFGTFGVASYTIIGYFIMISTMLSFGIADALQPIISKNFGALKYDRINSFLNLGFISILCIEVVLIFLILIFPEEMINIFLEKSELKTKEITLQFISYAWPAFLFLGLNILITSYLTSIQKPLYSFSIAILRSLALPILFIMILPLFFGNIGIFLALSFAELMTFLLAFRFFSKNRLIS